MIPRRLERLPQWPLGDGLEVHEATTFASRLLGLAWLDELPQSPREHVPGKALGSPVRPGRRQRRWLDSAYFADVAQLARAPLS